MYTQPIQVGDTVRHTTAYLQSAGWYTEVPINGHVIRVTLHSGVPTLIEVEWSQDAPAKILAIHLERTSAGDSP